MIDVTRIKLSKDRLKAMPKDECALFFLLGHAANQIVLFQRLIVFCTNKASAEEVERNICAAQLQILARFAVGILHESWMVIQKRFLGSPMGKEFTPKLNPAGTAALAALKKHFGGSNAISKLRNNAAFHYPGDGDMDVGFRAAADDTAWDDEWNWYFTASTWNSYYFASDFVILHAILASVGETDLVEAQRKIMADVQRVSEDMIVLASSLTEAFLTKFFGPELHGTVVAKIAGAPGFEDVSLPFYVEVPADGPGLAP